MKYKAVLGFSIEFPKGSDEKIKINDKEYTSSARILVPAGATIEYDGKSISPLTFVNRGCAVVGKDPEPTPEAPTDSKKGGNH